MQIQAADFIYRWKKRKAIVHQKMTLGCWLYLSAGHPRSRTSSGQNEDTFYSPAVDQLNGDLNMLSCKVSNLVSQQICDILSCWSTAVFVLTNLDIWHMIYQVCKLQRNEQRDLCSTSSKLERFFFFYSAVEKLSKSSFMSVFLCVKSGSNKLLCDM